MPDVRASSRCLRSPMAASSSAHERTCCVLVPTNERNESRLTQVARSGSEDERCDTSPSSVSCEALALAAASG